MSKSLLKYKIKIPNNTTVLYCSKKKIITLIGPQTIKSAKIQLDLQLLDSNKTIVVTSSSVSELPNIKKKQIKALQGTLVALIKQLLMETSIMIYKKLKLIGVGYKAFYVDDFTNQLLWFKLGFSHSIYFKIPKNLQIFCLKQTKLFICGVSYQTVTQIAAKIQACKFPEPYKGKGILYDDAKIQLKEGKKHK